MPESVSVKPLIPNSSCLGFSRKWDRSSIPAMVFRPNAEFAFGEVTDLVAINLEATYRFSAANRRNNWTPYVGAGPALIFIHQNFEKGRNIDFGNFDYETGFQRSGRHATPHEACSWN